mgnify:CR=1 FL=1
MKPVLVVNSGSSSLKYQLIDVDTEHSLASGLIERVTDHDGMRPLSEHVWLHLKEGGDEQGQHLLALDAAGDLVGYAHLDVTDAVEAC